ncbi:hypothetical protein AC480_05545 [miscellaneous Crenarchaeota group archaeon SMTZ1-55]|nr:MAG: hypothetical protein AC480_05545 [miscellaneous Crenarchaeota group archaeon SMTZ1-55]
MDKVYVAVSTIHGNGVFARCAIQEGQRILMIDDSRIVTDDAPLRPENGEYEHHCDYVEKGKVILMQEPERSINHSCDPNVYIRQVAGVRYVYAMRAIHAEEELTFDYCINGYGDGVWHCTCGSPQCRKTIHIDFFQLPREKQREYLPYLDTWFIREFKKKVEEIYKNTSVKP